MTKIIIALGWAIAIFATAFAGQAGVISTDSAQNLIIVLPALAVVTIIKPQACALACFGARRA